MNGYDVRLFDRAVVADPYPVYEEIRACGRVVWNEAMHAWMAHRFDDCTEILSDHSGRFGQMNNPTVTPWFEAPNMITADGAEHTRLRRSLAPFFTRHAIAEWDARVADVAREVVSRLVAEGRFHIVADFGMIPTTIVADMLGAPKDRYRDFKEWSDPEVGNMAYGHEDPGVFEAICSARREANRYLEVEVMRRHGDAGRDLLTEMIRTSDMSDEEVRSTALLLLLAGYDTTAKLLALCLVVLAQHPDARAELAERPHLIPAGVEEVLRWASVTQFVPKRVLLDTELGGTQLAQGDVVYVMHAAANRDPLRWDDPLRFDIHREAKAHLGFGFGVHLCLGAALARLEVRYALGELLALAPTYRVTDVDFGTGMVVRGPEQGFVEVR